MTETIVETLNLVGIADPRLEPGQIEESTKGFEGLTTTDQVFLRIREFNPQEGWLLSAHHPGPLILGDSLYLGGASGPASGRMPDDNRRAIDYPLSGEFCRDRKSLHLRQDGQGGWTLTKLVFNGDASAENGSVATVLQLRRDCPGHLKYQVFYKAQKVDAHEELRPFNFRFAGFV